MKIEYTVPKVLSISIVELKTSSTMKLTKKKKGKKRILRNNSEELAHNEETTEQNTRQPDRGNYRSQKDQRGGFCHYCCPNTGDQGKGAGPGTGHLRFNDSGTELKKKGRLSF